MVILQKSLKKQQNATAVLRIQTMRGAVIAHFKHLKEWKPAM
jgi:hypothetical protein